VQHHIAAFAAAGTREMKSLFAKLSIAAIGLSLAAAPAAASAAGLAVGVNVAGPGYAVHAGYVNPGGPCYGCAPRPWSPPPRYVHPYWHPYGWRPGPVVHYDGYYGLAPGGFYGYYWHGGWYGHRRWANGIWIYF
jgi:hypothetical protein